MNDRKADAGEMDRFYNPGNKGVKPPPNLKENRGGIPDWREAKAKSAAGWNEGKPSRQIDDFSIYLPWLVYENAIPE
jgi:hypothetical protein